VGRGRDPGLPPPPTMPPNTRALPHRPGEGRCGGWWADVGGGGGGGGWAGGNACEGADGAAVAAGGELDAHGAARAELQVGLQHGPPHLRTCARARGALAGGPSSPAKRRQGERDRGGEEPVAAAPRRGLPAFLAGFDAT
jgi:hypothetical protein